MAGWLESSLTPDMSFDKVVHHLTHRLETQHKRIAPLDTRFYRALHYILKHNGVIDIKKDLDVGLSPRQLQRVFNYYLGTTPKAFSNVVRFQHILNSQTSLKELRENKLYFEAGFYDQAHFIRHFKTFYGVTPSEAFG